MYAVLTWLALNLAGTLVGKAAKWTLDRILGQPLDRFEQAIESAIESARIKFHERYANKFGPLKSTFIDQERNRRALIRSTFPRGKRLAANDIDHPHGFDRAPDAPAEAVEFFLQAFYHALDQTESRTLDRDRAFQETNRNILQIGAQCGDIFDEKMDKLRREKALPDPIRAAITQPHLDELTELMKAGRAQDALAFADRHTKAIDTAFSEVDDPDRRYAEELRTHRQRLLFAAASAASWLGDIEAGRTRWRRARDLGRIDPECHEQAAGALFNVRLVDDLRHLMSQMKQESEAYRQTVPLLAFLEGKWQTVDEQLVSAESTDLLLIRAHARIQILDPQDVNAVLATADLIDQTERDSDPATIKLFRAQETFNLLKRVVEEYTPLDYDRRSLVDNLTRRVIALVKATQSDSPLQARVLGILADTTKLLSDEALDALFGNKFEALDTEARSRVFFLYDSPPTPEKIADMLDSGQIDFYRAAILKASYYSSIGQPDKVECVLREALFATSDEHQRAHVLRLFTRHLRKQNQDVKAQRLIEETPLRPADRWLLRAESLPRDSLPADMIDEVEDFPLDVNVLAWLAQSSVNLAFANITPPMDTTDAAVDIAEAAVQWAARLVKVLPSRSYRFLYAEALYVARRYDDFLTACQDVDPIYGERIVELKASALKGLGRISEAADILIAALDDYPSSERIAINASGLLLADDRPEEAANILEPRVTAECTEPGILVNLAQSLLIQDIHSRDNASRAFDLLAQAYELRPNLEIAHAAWKAAQGAGREQEAERFFDAMTKETPHATVRTAEDMDEILRAESQVFVHLEKGGLEALAESIRQDRERADRLNKLSSDHILAYGDLFRASGRPWEHWSNWTQWFKRLKKEDRLSPGAFSILADWPLEAFAQTQDPNTEAGVLADITAILTLGVLGPDIAQQILVALGKIHVQAGTLNSLREERSRIEASPLIGPQPRYVETARILRGIADAIIPYTEEIENAAPNASSLGAYRVDIGAAILHKALYVTDFDGIQEWPYEIRQRTISSDTLLAALNAAGVIGLDEARRAAERNPDIFGGWETIESYPPTPETLVFSEFTLMDWVDTGLTGALGKHLKVGPLAWTHIADVVEQREALVLAHERLQELIPVLKAAAERGEFVEVEAAGEDTAHSDRSVPPARDISSLEAAWAHALQSLRTAQKHGLQLWADDRFYPLLLWAGRPTIRHPEIEAVRDPFVDWANTTPPISTMGLLDRLSISEYLAADIAQGAADRLFSQGYRMAHPILLGHALRQFPLPVETPLTPPFQKIVDAIVEIPHYLPDTIDPFHRAGLLRLASAKIVGRFIENIWRSPYLSNDQRRTLADAFLDALEDIFKYESAAPAAPRSDRTALFFWMEIGKTLQLMPAHDSDCAEIKNAALHWFGHAVAHRVKQRQDIVRLLEDSMLTFIDIALEAFTEIEGKDQLPQIIREIVIPPLIPLTGTELLDTLDPLLRRTVGTLINFIRDGRINILCNIEIHDEEFQLTVSEEDNEQAAADVLRRIAAGDMISARLVHATDVVFKYIHPVSEEWINAGIPPEVEISIDVRCSLFTLLWADPPDLQKIIVGIIIHRLTYLDPVLADRVIQLEADLTCNDKNKAREARDKLAIDVLRSGYFDLQRDLAHAIWRFRNYNTDALSRFIGQIGEDAARALVDHPSVENAYQIGEFLVPRHHRIARAILTDRWDDEALVLEALEKMINPADGPNDEEDAPPNLADWLANRASAVETTDDPFIAAWSLRQILLALSTISENPLLDVDERKVSTSNWAIGYLETALTTDIEQPSTLEEHMMSRRQLASGVLQLAAFACDGDKHFTVYNVEEDPLTEWMDRVWLLASKLQIALVGLEGNLTDAVAKTTTAVQELGLATSNARVPDAFDPLAFGVDGDDIGIALTLTAMLKVLRQTEGRMSPPWWTVTIQDQVENLAAAPPPDIEGIGNRLGLTAPLRVQTLAQRILEMVRKNWTML